MTLMSKIFKLYHYKNKIIQSYKHENNLKKINPKKDIYFWKLHDWISKEHVIQIITIFYSKVFNDKTPENKFFVDEFKQTGHLYHHIHRQSLFWLVMFGFNHKDEYKGGVKTLNKHHTLVSEIMTNRGAHLWMMYMKHTLNEYKEVLDEINIQIYPCILDFVLYLMFLYSKQFDFNFKYIPRFKISSKL